MNKRHIRDHIKPLAPRGFDHLDALITKFYTLFCLLEPHLTWDQAKLMVKDYMWAKKERQMKAMLTKHLRKVSGYLTQPRQLL